MKLNCILPLFLGAVACVDALADRLKTAPPNNGRSDAGVFVDLTATAGDMVITEIGMTVAWEDGDPVRLRVWRRAGSYVGFDGTPDGWEVIDRVDALAAPRGLPTAFILNDPIELRHGEISGFLFEGEIGGARYTGTPLEPPQTEWVNENLRLFSDVARAAPPFQGKRFSPRCFSGYIEYTVLFSLSLVGDCPGSVTMEVSGATPGSNVALASAFGTGNQEIPQNRPCAGTVLGLNQTARLVGVRAADGDGRVSVTLSVAPGACNRVFVQAIDIASCATTNVEAL